MLRLAVSIAAVFLTVSIATAQDTGQSPGQGRGQAIEALIEGSGDESIRQFIETHVAPEYRATFAPGKLEEHLRAIRAACANFGGILADRTDDGGTRLTFMQGPRETSVVFRVQKDPPYQIVALELEPTRPSENAGPAMAPITWDTLAQRLDEEAKQGFTGTVLVAHGGKVVLHQGYGMANRERKIPNTTETVFAIGSTPIDFTKAAILKLEETGKLHTSDPITKFLAGVPTDKQAMTIDHLMHGASGLPNFHHVNGVDADKDLSWIDRDEAVRRILGQPLLFAPGEGNAHSHSAWVLLAAIVEIVSKQSYGEFLQKNFFEPAGMTRTGLHEDAARFDDRELAVGYDGQPVGALNTPKYWGKTSWLVMGSGGMESDPMDLYKWMNAIRSGRTLKAAAAAKYWSHGVLAGGDDRGFFCLYTEGPDDMMILCSNTRGGPKSGVGAVGRRLVELVQPMPKRPR